MGGARRPRSWGRRVGRRRTAFACRERACEHVFVSGAGILHADLDAFFASVEQRDDPALRGRPVIVGGGVVLAASYEAARCGVRTAMGGTRRARLCPDAIVVPPRMSAYTEASRAVFEIFAQTSPRRRRDLDRRGVPRRARDRAHLRHAGGDRRAAAARRARAGRAADHRRRREHQVPGQGRERRRQARRPARRARRRRAGLPAPAPGRADVGRRRGHGRASCTRRASRRSGSSRRLSEGALATVLGPRRGAPPARARAQPRPAPRRAAAGGGDRWARSARSGAGRARRPSSTRCSSRSSTASRGGCARRGRVCRTVVLRLRFGDYSRATRSHTLPRGDGAHRADPGDGARAARRRAAARSRRRGSRCSASRSRTCTTTARCSSRCRSIRAAAAGSTRRSTRSAIATGRRRSAARCCWAATVAWSRRCCPTDGDRPTT